VQAIFDGLWLGLFSREDLHSLDHDHYSRLQPYGDEAYNLKGLFEWEKEVLGRYLPAAGRIAVYGAGGGREVLALENLGYEVDGYECHPKLRDLGNELLAAGGFADRLSPTPRDEWPGLTGYYHGIIVGWGTFMLIPGRARRIALLRQASAHTNGGSPIFLSFFTRTKDSGYFWLVKVLGNLLRRVRRQERLELGDSLAPNYVHFFTEREVAEELSAAGFELEMYKTSPYGHAVGRRSQA
jgi:hypothetical protein